jgi:hypothetical protein
LKKGDETMIGYFCAGFLVGMIAGILLLWVWMRLVWVAGRVRAVTR